MLEFFELIGEVFDQTGAASGLLILLWVLCLLWAVFTADQEHKRRSRSEYVDDIEHALHRKNPSSFGSQTALNVFLFFIVAVPAGLFSWLALGLFDFEGARERVFLFFILLLTPLLGLIAVNAVSQGARWQQTVRKGLKLLVLAIMVAAFFPAVQARVYWHSISGLSETYRGFLDHDFKTLKYYPASAEDAALRYLQLWSAGPHVTQANIVLDEVLWHSMDMGSQFSVGRTGRRGLESLAAYIETFPDGRHAADIAARINLHNIGKMLHYVKKPAAEALYPSIETKIWALAKEQDQAWAYKTYIRSYPEGEFVEPGQVRIEALDWQQTAAKNTVDDYLEFKARYLTSSRISELERRINVLRWEQVSAENTVRHYLEFRERYPGSTYIDELLKRVAALRVDESVWELVRRSASTADIDRFLTDFPGHKNQADAMSLAKGVDFRTLLEKRKISMSFHGCGIQIVCGEIENLTETPLRALVPAGSLFVSSDPKAQSMSVVRTSVKFVGGNKSIPVKLSAACADIKRNIPYNRVSFSFASISEDESLTSIKDALDSDKATWDIRQAMVWIVRDNASRRSITTRLVGGLISDDEVTKALTLLEKVGYPVKTRSAWRER